MTAKNLSLVHLVYVLQFLWQRFERILFFVVEVYSSGGSALPRTQSSGQIYARTEYGIARNHHANGWSIKPGN